MNPVARTLILIGVLFLIAGALWQAGFRLPLGRLPGDVVIERENFRFYFPIVSGILISVLLSLVLFVIRLFVK